MNRDLIKQLQSLSPSEDLKSDGTWNPDPAYIEDDAILITLAPTMRQEILAMAKEIKELRSQLSLAHELIKTQPK